MCATRIAEPRTTGSRIEAGLTWLGGGDRGELAERHERSIHVIAGVVVLLGAALAWLVADLAVAGSTRSPMAVVIPVTLVFGLLVGAVSRAIASGPTRGWPGVVGRGAVAVVVGVVVGDLAALVLFSGSIDRLLDEQATRSAESVPVVAQASAGLDRPREARTALDDAVEQAGAHREEALVVARCEYNPTPACPQTHITGVPGTGPENRTANEFLADTQRELDNALAERDRRAPELDAEIADGEQALTRARATAIAEADHGLGGRWVAMNDHTLASPGAMLLRLLTIGFFALLSLLPLILKLWRGETTQDRGAAARAERNRAELQADTAVAVKHAEVRAAVETMWAEQQLASARLAVEAQIEIDRELQRRRVIEVAEPAILARVERISEPGTEDTYLPIAAEAETASLAPAPLPARGDDAPVEPRREGGAPLIPTIPDVTKAAARWIRPFVPPIIARAIGTTTQPVRAALQVFEETEEVHFTLKRTRKVTVHSEESGEFPGQRGSEATDTTADPRWVESTTVGPDDRDQLDARAERSSLGPTVDQPALTERDGPREVRGPDRPRQLPPAG
ncbi:MAG: Conserved rane integral protein of unknown function [Mycobacterium sp.]|nr:Conserved rane integral protein of unknown function [Mycobacterium sp.]